MNVDVCIESADLKGALRTYIKRRLHFSLGRYGGKLGRVRVRVQDVPGAGELPDASCQIQAQVLPAGRVLRQEAADRNLYVAVDLATERIGRSFGRELESARASSSIRETAGAGRVRRNKI